MAFNAFDAPVSAGAPMGGGLPPGVVAMQPPQAVGQQQPAAGAPVTGAGFGNAFQQPMGAQPRAQQMGQPQAQPMAFQQPMTMQQPMGAQPQAQPMGQPQAQPMTMGQPQAMGQPMGMQQAQPMGTQQPQPMGMQQPMAQPQQPMPMQQPMGGAPVPQPVAQDGGFPVLSSSNSPRGSFNMDPFAQSLPAPAPAPAPAAADPFADPFAAAPAPAPAPAPAAADPFANPFEAAPAPAPAPAPAAADPFADPFAAAPAPAQAPAPAPAPAPINAAQAQAQAQAGGLLAPPPPGVSPSGSRRDRMARAASRDSSSPILSSRARSTSTGSGGSPGAGLDGRASPFETQGQLRPRLTSRDSSSSSMDAGDRRPRLTSSDSSRSRADSFATDTEAVDGGAMPDDDSDDEEEDAGAGEGEGQGAPQGDGPDTYEVELTGAELGLVLERRDAWADNETQERALVQVVLRNTSAAEAGVKVRSRLLSVNGDVVTDMPFQSVLAKLRVAVRPTVLVFEEPAENHVLEMGVYYRRSDPTKKAPSMLSKWQTRYVLVGGGVAPAHTLQIYNSKGHHEETVVNMCNHERPQDVQFIGIYRQHKCSPIFKKSYDGRDVYFFTFKTRGHRFNYMKLGTPSYEKTNSLRRRITALIAR